MKVVLLRGKLPREHSRPIHVLLIATCIELVHVRVISLHHNPCRLLNNSQLLLQNFSESIVLPLFQLLHMLSMMLNEHILSVANQRTYLLAQLKSQGLSHRPSALYYLLPLYCLLSVMLMGVASKRQEEAITSSWNLPNKKRPG